ncbi:Nitrogen permease regulator 2 [[Candida] zeylanoides]
MASDGFVPILAVFYAVFHPTEGTKILHQVPEGSVATTSAPSAAALFTFDTVKNYVIPKPQLCDRLVSFKIDRFRVLGYPVNVPNPDYARNSFSFNFCFVFPYDSDTTPYELCIRRTGKMFRVLEEQSFMLSRLDVRWAYFKPETRPVGLLEPPPLPGHTRHKRISLSSIESLIQQIYSDLNNYSECCIPLDSANSVDIKLFPILPPPVNIKAFQVPLATVNLAKLVDVNWDPTMLRILPHINGLNSIRRISELADSDYMLTKQCVQHLMHYKCIDVLDVFQFGNIYAPTNRIGDFLRVPALAAQCQAYVISDVERLSTMPLTSPSPSSQTPVAASGSAGRSYFHRAASHTPATPGTPRGSVAVPSRANLFFLYRSLHQGQTIREWVLQHRRLLVNVDVRRLVTFGVIHGLIYRVHSYPVLNKPVDTGNLQEPGSSRANEAPSRARARKVSFGYAPDASSALSDDESATSTRSAAARTPAQYAALRKLLSGHQHFDSICTELSLPRATVETMLEDLGSYAVINA